jgi:hypothetical protein
MRVLLAALLVVLGACRAPERARAPDDHLERMARRANQAWHDARSLLDAEHFGKRLSAAARSAQDLLTESHRPARSRSLRDDALALVR